MKRRSTLMWFYDISFFEFFIAKPFKLDRKNTKGWTPKALFAKERRKIVVNYFVGVFFIIPLLIFILSGYYEWRYPYIFPIIFAVRLLDLVPHLLDSLFHSEGVQYYERRVVLALINYAEIIFWFAAFYLIFPAHFNIAASYWPHSLESSFRNMVTFQPSIVRPTTFWGILILLIQSFIGWFMTIGVLAIFISTLTQKKRR